MGKSTLTDYINDSGIRFKSASILETSKTLHELSPSLLPPQSYRYISDVLFNSLLQ